MTTAMPAPQEAPVIRIGSGKVGMVASAGIRTGLQGGAGKFILDGLETFSIYHPTPDQREWLIIAFGVLVAMAQWAIEVWRNRKFIGAAPEPATRSDSGHGVPDWAGWIVALVIILVLLRVFHLI